MLINLIITLLILAVDSVKDYHIFQGIDYIYHENYESAHQEFDTLTKIYPEDPEGFFYLSSLLETLESFNPCPETKAQLDSLADIAVRLAERKLKAKKSAYNLFYVGSTRGERAVRRALHGDWIGCLLDGIEARSNLELAFKEDSTLLDVYMGFGLYDYYLGKYLSFIPWLKGRKLKGINELKVASQNGKYSRKPALFFLLRVYLLEDMDSEAMQIIKELRQVYPTNTSLLHDKARVYYKEGEYQKAITACNYSLSLSKTKRPLNSRARASCYLMLVKSHNELKEIEKARTNCELATQELNGINEDWAKELRKEAQELSQEFKGGSLMHIAPKDLIWRDFRNLHKERELLTEPIVEDLLFIQTIEGHSHNGDGAFKGRKFVDTTINDIAEALGRDVFIVRSERQMLIDEICEYAERVINGENLTRLVNKRSEPLMRCPLFLHWEVNPEDVLKGLYLGGLMDDFSVRKKVNKKFQANLGGGKPYLIDLRVMERMGLNGEILAHGNHEDKIGEYINKGLIISDSTNVDFLRHPNVRFQYIRHKKGLGISDDAAVLMGGLLYNMSVGLGAYLADAIDTLDKYSLKFIEQDDTLARTIERNFPDLAITEEEVFSFINLIAIPEGREKEVPDCSQRYFLQIDEKANLTALESHYRFIVRLPYPRFSISYERVLNEDFYRYIKERLESFKENGV
jgi:tetratricopeptide (TPR) repeat protein